MENWIWVGWVIGGIGAIGSIIAAVWAILGWRKASDANDTATEALELTRKADARATEHKDFDWRWDWPEPGVLALLNAGQSPARKVAVTLTIDKQMDHIELGDLTPRVTHTQEIPWAREIYQTDERQERDPMAQFTMPLNVMTRGHIVSVRLNWETEAGTPLEFLLKNNLCRLGPRT